MRNKYLCVHGHFYQPPRENPWLEAVEPEESAYPFRDWNERIFQECYGPNLACPVPGEDGRLLALADNYRKMSFNFGPTLLVWLERERPRFYRELLAADADSARERGHGNALAQPYVHAILPLQSPRDRRTLVEWGLDDFRLRFGRDSEGLWLPETAVDEDTLELLIDSGVRFTILSPTQAARVRPIGSGEEGWREVSAAALNPCRPYRWVSRRRPERQLAIFFYHEGLHRAVVDGDAFRSTTALFEKLLARVLPDDSTQLVSVATDGEFYGHHHRSGAAGLAHAFRLAEHAGLQTVNYAQFLDLYPPPEEVEIRPRTAWSCEHGLGRWEADCGCRMPGRKPSSQAWRAPLRLALNGLAARLDETFEAHAGRYFKDFWRARDEYARRLIDLSAENAAAFLAQRALVPLAGEEFGQALRLLELQRQRLAMFTSCGWFFDDVSGLETAQCLKHAARAIELAAGFGADLTPQFKLDLMQCPSNAALFGDGAKVYEKLAEPARAGLDRVAAHAALLGHLGRPIEPLGELRFEAGPLERRESLEPGRRDRSASRRELTVVRRHTLESGRGAALVHQADRLDLSCRFEEPGAGTDWLERFSSGGDAESFELWASGAFGAAVFTLESLLAGERREALRLLMPKPAASASLRRRVLEGFAEAIERPSLPSLSAAARRLEACERGGLAVDVWSLQELFWRWRGRLLSGAESTQSERELAVVFAEKLNFAQATMPIGAQA